jgi:hypothetical protein
VTTEQCIYCDELVSTVTNKQLCNPAQKTGASFDTCFERITSTSTKKSNSCYKCQGIVLTMVEQQIMAGEQKAAEMLLQKERRQQGAAAKPLAQEFHPEQLNPKTKARGLETEADAKLLSLKLEAWARSLMLRK